jgi:matrixin
LTAGAQLRTNWTSSDAGCARYNDLRNRVLGNIGIKIDASEPWAAGFRRAITFWNTVLVANFHEETDLSACAVRVINGDCNVLHDGIVARAQIPEWADFRGKIAVRPAMANELSSAEIYGIAVHELGHLLGLRHNTSPVSVMYFLDVNGDEVLDIKDLVALSRRHKVRPSIFSAGYLSIQVFESTAPAVARRDPEPVFQN